MPGSISDWEFKIATTGASSSAQYSLSSDYSRAGSKSLKFKNNTSYNVVNNVTYLNSQDKGRISVWYYFPTVAQTPNNSYIYMGLHVGGYWSTSWREGYLGSVYWNPNTPTVSYLTTGYFNAGNPTSRSSISNLSLNGGNWYRLEVVWKIITNAADSQNYFSGLTSIYDSNNNLVKNIGSIEAATYYHESSGNATIGMFHYTASTSNSIYADDFIAYE